MLRMLKASQLLGATASSLAPGTTLALFRGEDLRDQILALVGQRLDRLNGLSADVRNRVLGLLQDGSFGTLGGRSALARGPGLTGGSGGGTDGRMVGFLLRS